MAIIQKNRYFAIASVFGDDVLVFRCMTGTEKLGRMFDYKLDLLSERNDLAFEDVIGTNMTLRISFDEGDDRYFNGLIAEFWQTGMVGKLYAYKVQLRPWLWMLTRTSDCRIFQYMTVPNIILKVFRDHGLTDFRDKLTESYPKHDYRVQYYETDFAFVSRLAEEYGIYYYVEHENGLHYVVLADGFVSHETAPDYEEVPYYPPDRMNRRERDHICKWQVGQTVQTGRVVLNDFDFKRPKTPIEVRAFSIHDYGSVSQFERYDYPARYADRAVGEQLAKTRMEEIQTNYEIAGGEGNVRGISVGGVFSLTNYPREDQNRQYLVREAHYMIESDDYQVGQGGGKKGDNFYCTFTVMDRMQPFRAASSTTKPTIDGPQTAIVVGKEGEELWIDEHARIKVQFHWDRYGRSDENSSCWIRVSHLWAGENWGAVFNPRIGQEVVVEFLEGDPDRPLITGRLYNGLAKPPYELPQEMTKSTIKSNSSKGGQGFNELRFEDKKGQEQVFIHGEKNLDIRIENDRLEWHGRDTHLITKRHRKERVEGDQHITVQGDQFDHVQGDHQEKIGQERMTSVSSVDSLTVGSDQRTKIDGDSQTKVAGSVKLDSNTAITLSVGGSVIKIDGASITILAGTVTINSGGSPGAACVPPSAPLAAQEPLVADGAKSGEVDTTEAKPLTEKEQKYLDAQKVEGFSNPLAQALTEASDKGAAFVALK